MVGAMPSTWLCPRKDEPGVLRQHAVEFKKTCKDYDYSSDMMADNHDLDDDNGATVVEEK